ncbi:hypothetical protein BD769DRAFT_1345844 [Suillus cothurnatus]|nr:hypothetical protein BD769DRAFT_1345844 [Suillus cothurnatus]
MPKCLDLSRLPKAPGLRSINRRNVTPGSPLPLLFPGTASYNPACAIDPTHPATRWKAHAFPQFSCPAFMLRAVPKGALLRPDFELSRVERSAMVPRGERKDGSKRLDMSIYFMISKKKTNKRAVVRNRIAMRIRTAFELIVTRGADAELKDNVEGRQVGKECAPEESSNIVRKPKKKVNPTGRELKLANWTYVMSPSLLSYRMPLPDLIQHLRTGLESIRAQSMKLDIRWALDMKPTIQLPFTHITSEKLEMDWRHMTTDVDDIPVLFDLDKPEPGLIEAGKSINSQKRPIKLFFPTSPSSGESSSPLVGDDQPVTSPRSVDTPIRQALTANRPNRRSSGSVPDSSKTTLPAPSTFRMEAMERLAAMKNRPLAIPGRKVERRLP